MENDGRQLEEQQLALLGLPDDLPETALRDAPAPGADALARIKARTFAKAGVRPVPFEGRSTRRILRWGLAAAAILALAVVSAFGAMGQKGIWAAFTRFVPGFGLTPEQSVSLSAPQPVRMERGKAWVEVQGLVVANGYVTARVRAEGVVLARTRFEHESLVSVVTEKGDVLKKWSWGVGGSGDDDPNGAGEFEFVGPIPAESRKVFLVVKDTSEWRLEIPLVPTEQLPSVEPFVPQPPASPSAPSSGNAGAPAQTFGPSATVGPFRLSARVTPSDGRTAVTIVAQSSNGALVEGLMGEGLQPAITLSVGDWKTVPESADGIKIGGEQLWNFTAAPLPSGATSVVVKIPRLWVIEPGEATVRLKIADAPLNETIQLGRWPVRLVRTELEGGLRLWGDAGPGQVMQDAAGKHLDYLSTFGSFEVSGGNGGGGRRGRQDPFYAGEKRPDPQLMYVEFPVPGPSASDSNTVTVTLRNPNVWIQGPWVMTVPLTKDSKKP
jgi:hypothetical protein